MCASRSGCSLARRTSGVAEVAGIGSDDSGGAVGALLRLLRERGCARVFVEGGGVTVSAFLEANLLDRLHLAIAPVLIGEGRPAIRLAARDRLRDCVRPAYRVFRMGGDVLFDYDLGCQRRTLQRHHAHGACLTGYLAPLQDGRRHRPRTRAASDDSAGYRAARGCKLEVSHLSTGLSMVRLFAILVGVVLLSAPALAQQRIVALITSQDGVNPTTSLWEARIEAGQVRDARPLTIHDGWGGAGGHCGRPDGRLAADDQYGRHGPGGLRSHQRHDVPAAGRPGSGGQRPHPAAALRPAWGRNRQPEPERHPCGPKHRWAHARGSLPRWRTTLRRRCSQRNPASGVLRAPSHRHGHRGAPRRHAARQRCHPGGSRPRRDIRLGAFIILGGHYPHRSPAPALAALRRPASLDNADRERLRGVRAHRGRRRHPVSGGRVPYEGRLFGLLLRRW